MKMKKRKYVGMGSKYDNMEYKGYHYSIETIRIIPPMGQWTMNQLHFAGKITGMRSPDDENVGEEIRGEHLRGTEGDAFGAAAATAKKWIDENSK